MGNRIERILATCCDLVRADPRQRVAGAPEASVGHLRGAVLTNHALTVSSRLVPVVAAAAFTGAGLLLPGMLKQSEDHGSRYTDVRSSWPAAVCRIGNRYRR